MNKTRFIAYAQQVAAHVGTTDAARVLASYYMNTEQARATIAALGGEAVARRLLAENITKSENELLYL